MNFTEKIIVPVEKVIRKKYVDFYSNLTAKVTVKIDRFTV